MRLQSLPCALVLLLLLSACGSSDRGSINQDLSSIKARLQVLESQMSADDNDTAALISHCKDQVRQIQQLLIEDELSKAMNLLKEVQSQINNRTKQNNASQDLQIYGQVEYTTTSMPRYERLFNGESLDTSVKLKVGVRSALQYKPNPDLDLFLQAQTEIELFRGNPSSEIQAITLESGEIQITCTAKQPPFLFMDKLKLSLRSNCVIELSMPSRNSRPQLALLSGVLDWDYEKLSGSLVEYQGLVVENDTPRSIPLPLPPLLDDPAPDRVLPFTSGESANVNFRWHSKFFSPTYQLQISTNNLFITRVYDTNDLSISSVMIDLPAGQYFWRARAINIDRMPGPYSRALSFSISANAPKQPQAVEITRKQILEKGPDLTDLDIKLIGTTAIISGTTDPNAKVNVNGVSAIMMENGNFRAILNFDQPGTQTIRITSVSQSTGAETTLERKLVISR